MKVTRTLASALALAVFLLAGGGSAPAQAKPLGKVFIEFSFRKHLRIAGNQVAVWINDERGRYVATVYASRFTASGGFKRRPDALAVWVQASDWGQATKVEVDAVTRPTPRNGPVQLRWDCVDRAGRPVPPGVYTYRLESTIYWQNRALWTGRIRVGAGPDASQAQPVYEPKGAEREGIQVTEVSARFVPDGE